MIITNRVCSMYTRVEYSATGRDNRQREPPTNAQSKSHAADRTPTMFSDCSSRIKYIMRFDVYNTPKGKHDLTWPKINRKSGEI